MFHLFLVNNSRITENNNNNSKNYNFAFQTYALGQNFVKIMNLYLSFFPCKIAWSYNAKDALSTKNPTRHNTKNERR